MSARSATKHARTQLLLLFAAVVLVAGLIAVPAAAAATTTLTAKANTYTVTWGKYAIATATLMDTSGPTPVAVGGQTVRLEWSLTGAPLSWNLLAELTTDDAQYYTGAYAGVVYPKQLTYYRFNFLGGGGYDPAPSNVLVIQVRPALGVPTVPKSAKVNKSFTVYGSLKPQFPAGAKTVKLQAYRYNGHSWVYSKSYRATNFDNGSYTKYKLSLKIAKKGKYRFKASTAAMTINTTPQTIYAPATTGYSKTLQVK